MNGLRIKNANFIALLSVLFIYLMEIWYLPRVQFSDFAYYLGEATTYNSMGYLNEYFIQLKSPLVIGFLGFICGLNLSIWKISMLIIVLLISTLYLIFHKKDDNYYKWIGFYLVAFSPILISLFPYVNTDILFAGIFIVGHIIFYRISNNTRNSKLSDWILLALIFGIAQSVRSVMLYYFIFLIMFLLMYIFQYKISFKRVIFRNIFISFILFLITTVSIHKYYGYGWRIQPQTAGLVSLYIGSNAQFRGGYCDEDGAEVGRLVRLQISSEDELYRDSLKELATNRIIKNLSSNLLSLPIKAFNLHNPYVTSVFLDLRNRNAMEVLLKFLLIVISFLTILTYLLNFFVLTHAIFRNKQEHLPLYYRIILLAVYSYSILHISLLEIQPRYFLHLSLIQLFLLNDTVKYLINLKKTTNT